MRTAAFLALNDDGIVDDADVDDYRDSLADPAAVGAAVGC